MPSMRGARQTCVVDTSPLGRLHSRHMPRPGRFYWFLVALAVVMVLGHICALPLHAHAGAITTHEEGGSHHGHGDSGDDAVHGASCDALRTAAGTDGIAILIPIGIVPSVVTPSARHLVEADSSVVFGSPPLFLLHAVLLI